MTDLQRIWLLEALRMEEAKIRTKEKLEEMRYRIFRHRRSGR